MKSKYWAASAIALAAALGMNTVFAAQSARPTPIIASGSGGLQVSVSKAGLKLDYASVTGTDDAGTTTLASVPDGSLICLKSNDRRSPDWRNGVKLGSINMKTCSWGTGAVKGGVATIVAEDACNRVGSDGRAIALISGIVQTADGKQQGWVPHFSPYSDIAPNGKDLTVIRYNCRNFTVAGPDGNDRQAVANALPAPAK